MKDVLLSRIDAALLETQRLVAKLLRAREAIASEKESHYHSRSVAAAKRASLDAQEALVALRRNKWSR